MVSFGDFRAVSRLRSMNILLLLAAASSLCAGGEVLDVCLNEGDAVPEFEAKTANGDVWKSTDHVGKKYVVV